MKPFDYTKAKQGQPVCTRDGKNVRILSWDLKGSMPICVAVEVGEDKDFVYRVHYDGKHDDRTDSNYDLMMCPTKHTAYSVMQVSIGDLLRFVFETEEEAENYANSANDCTVVKLEWEE